MMRKYIIALFILIPILIFSQKENVIYVGYTPDQITAKKKLIEAENELNQGKDFCEVFNKYSDNRKYKNCGIEEHPARTFIDILRSMEVGEYSSILQSKYAFHIFKKEKKQDGTAYYRQIIVNWNYIGLEDEGMKLFEPFKN